MVNMIRMLAKLTKHGARGEQAPFNFQVFAGLCKDSEA